MSVAIPRLVPFSNTLAPITGSPSASTTVPLTVTVAWDATVPCGSGDA